MSDLSKVDDSLIDLVTILLDELIDNLQNNETDPEIFPAVGVIKPRKRKAESTHFKQTTPEQSHLLAQMYLFNLQSYRYAALASYGLLNLDDEEYDGVLVKAYDDIQKDGHAFFLPFSKSKSLESDLQRLLYLGPADKIWHLSKKNLPKTGL